MKLKTLPGIEVFPLPVFALLNEVSKQIEAYSSQQIGQVVCKPG